MTWPFEFIWIRRGWSTITASRPSRRRQLARWVILFYATNVLWNMWETYQGNPQGFTTYLRGEQDLLPLLYLPPPLLKADLSSWMDLSFLAVMLLILFWAIGPHSLLKVTIYLLVVFGIALIAPISRGSTRAAVVSAWTWWIQTAWPWLVKAALSPWTTAVLGLLLAAGCLLAFLFTGHQVIRMAGGLITDEMDLLDATRFLTFVLGGAIVLGVISEIAAWSVQLMRNSHAFPGWPPFLWTVFITTLAATTAVTLEMASEVRPPAAEETKSATPHREPDEDDPWL
ncbi:hypothetical protein AB0K21_08860 [Streptosporangium sp. NPDC049248]|uniref:hypothetical protein n=1 Tax=Streptosporangium sp. NPDC049248 TaxID=3155651 RepID=UPI003430E429